jgi:hypothetical protein
VTGVAIEHMLDLWSTELREVKAHPKSLYAHRSVATSAAFLDGLLGPERHKTGWMRAEAAENLGPWRQQAVLGRSCWDADSLRHLVRSTPLRHRLLWRRSWRSTRPAFSNKTSSRVAWAESTADQPAKSPTVRSAYLKLTCRMRQLCLPRD